MFTKLYVNCVCQKVHFLIVMLGILSSCFCFVFSAEDLVLQTVTMKEIDLQALGIFNTYSILCINYCEAFHWLEYFGVSIEGHSATRLALLTVNSRNLLSCLYLMGITS